MSETNKNVPEKDGADRLYRAIGQIDDRYVSEAIEYRTERTKRARILPRPRILATVAAALLVLTVAIGIFIDPILGNGGADLPSDDSPEQCVWSAAKGYPSNLSLLSCLSESRTEADASDERPALDTGKVTVIWRDESDGTYYTVTVDFLSQTQTRRLRELMQSASASAVDRGSEAPPFSLWISMGDGTAVSPYLGASDGNVSYGVPSDYAPEQLPSEALAKFLTALIEKNLP